MAFLFWLSWLLLTPVFALPWFGPQETFYATATADWSPVPTNGIRELFKRGFYPVSLCGWQGPDYQGAYCSSGSSCAWFTDYSVIGCCVISGFCDAVYTSCIDGSHPPQSVSYPGVVTCTSTSVCYLNTFPNGYVQYGCGSTSAGETVVTSWTGINTALSIAIAYTGGVLEAKAPVKLTSRTAAAASSTTDARSTAAASSATSDASSTPGTSQLLTSSAQIFSPSLSTATSSITSSMTLSSSIAPPPTPGEGISTGAKIAIGVLAATIAIIAVVLSIFWCARRHKQLGASQFIPNTTANAHIPPDEQLKGTEDNPAELFQSDQPQSNYVPYNPVTVLSYRTIVETPGQSSTNTESVSAVSPRSSNISPVPAMNPIPDMFELPTKSSTSPAIAGAAGAALSELDNSEIRITGMFVSQSGSSITPVEGNLARLDRETERVRAEKKMAI